MMAAFDLIHFNERRSITKATGWALRFEEQSLGFDTWPTTCSDAFEDGGYIC